MALAVEARKELVVSIAKLLSLLAVETNNAGVYCKGSTAAARHQVAHQKVIAERHAWVQGFVESILSVFHLGELEADQIRTMVASACEDNVVVTQGDTQQQEFVVVRTLQSVIGDLVQELQASTANKEAWLELVFKILVREQVDRRCYDARARASLKRLVRSLGIISWRIVAAIESTTAEAQLRAIEDGAMVPEGGIPGRGGRYVKVALAALGGGALLMYTGSMAAPSIAASLVALCTAGGISTSTSALFTYLGLSSTSAISTFFGATGVGLTGYKMSRRTLGVREFYFIPLHSATPLDEPESATTEVTPNTGLPVFICVPGWVGEGQDPRQLWGGTGACIDGRVASAATAPAAAWTNVEEVEEGSDDDDDDDDDTTTMTITEKTTTLTDEDGEEVTTIETTVDYEEVTMGPSTPRQAAGAMAAAAAMGSSVDQEQQQEDLMLGSWQVMRKASTGWWREHIPGGEEHVLIWETKVLDQLHKVMREFVWNEASRYAIDEMIKHTALAGLTSAAALPMTILDAAAKLDNPWAVAMDRAKEAGQILADVLVSRPQGSRPVTLVGYSMGARVIYHCLEALYKKGEAGQGIVENAVLLGTPIGRSVERWRKVRSIVAGRLINGYSSKDWVLAFLFRSKTWELGVAGISPIDGGFVENVDLTDLVPGHLSLATSLPAIMAQLKLED